MADLAGDQYIKALESAVSTVKVQTAVFATPLVLLLAQIRAVTQIDAVWASALCTVAIVFLFFGTILAFSYWFVFDAALLKERLFEGDTPPSKGAKFFKIYEADIRKDGGELDEDYLIYLYNGLKKPMILCLIVGYVALAFLLLGLVWDGVFNGSETQTGVQTDA